MGLENPLHILIILAVVLMLFGAKRLPEMGKGLGSGIKGFREGLANTDPPAEMTAATPEPVATPAPATPEPMAAPQTAAAAPVRDPSAPAPADERQTVA